MGNKPSSKRTIGNSSLTSETDSSSGVSIDGSFISDETPTSTVDGDLYVSFEIPFSDLTIIRRTGSGDDTVFEAKWKDKLVAAKFLSHQGTQDGDLAADFAVVISQISDFQHTTHKNVVQFLGACVSADSPLVVVSELMHGSLHDHIVQLRQAAKKPILNMRQILGILLQTAQGMEFLHENGIVHGRLTTRKILLADRSPEVADGADISVKVGGYGLCHLDPILNSSKSNVARLTSPEIFTCKGSPTFESDVFTFSFVIYELLSGKEAFHEEYQKHSKAWVQEKVAKDPTFRPRIDDLPKRPAAEATLCEMLVGLMQDAWSHSPNERPNFSEIVVLLQDLVQLCDNPSYVSQFTNIRTKRHRAVFTIPEKLYGRDIEMEIIKEMIRRQSGKGVVPANATRALLIGGVSGIGKSALVKKLFADLSEEFFSNKDGITFVSGKYDQFNSTGAPYVAIVEAFRQFIMAKIILPGRKNPATIKKWKKDLIRSLDNSIQLMMDVIPEIGVVIGDKYKKKLKANAAAGAVGETKSRFTQAAIALMKLAANSHHKLVLFIDDLQWADQASLELINLLVTKNHHLFFVGAYRSNEVNAEHPLMKITVPVLKRDCKAYETVLEALSAKDLNNITCDALRYQHDCSQETMPLTELIYKRSGGNPFFFSQYLVSLYINKMVYFLPETESQSGRWAWDLEAIRTKGFTGAVADLMVLQIQLLSSKSQRILQLASCLGSSFSMSTLSVVCDCVMFRDGTKVGAISESDLSECISKNYLQFASCTMMGKHSSIASADNPLGVDKIFKFAHDRIQQAAFLILRANTNESLESVRYQIGEALLRTTNLEQFPNSVFNIVVNLNFGKNSTAGNEDVPRLIKLAELNLLASSQALQTGDYEGAHNYITTAQEVMFDRVAAAKAVKEGGTALNLEEARKQLWNDEAYHQLCFNITLQAQKLEGILSNFDKGDALFETIAKYSKNKYELATGMKEKLVQLEKQLKFFELLQTTSAFLLDQGEIPADLMSITWDQAKEAFLECKRLIEQDDFACIREAPLSFDPNNLSAFSVVSQVLLSVPSVMDLPILSTYFHSKVFIDNVARGTVLHESTFLAICSFPVSGAAAYADYKFFRDLGEVAFRYTNAYSTSPSFIFGYNNFCRPMSQPFQECISNAYEGNKIIQRAGNHIIYEYSVGIIVMSEMLVSPLSAPELIKKLGSMIPYFKEHGLLIANFNTSFVLLTLAPLVSSSHEEFEANVVAMQGFEQHALPQFPVKLSHMFYYVIKAFLFAILGDNERLIEAVQMIARTYSTVGVSITQFVQRSFVTLLAKLEMLAGISSAPVADKDSLASAVDQELHELKRLSDLYYANYGFFYHFALAHRARRIGIMVGAVSRNEYILDNYRTAVHLARASGSQPLKCLALEHLAQFLTETPGLVSKKVVLQSWWNAYSEYEKYNATYKLEQLKRTILSTDLVGSIEELKELGAVRITSNPQIIDAFCNACSSGNVDVVRKFLEGSSADGASVDTELVDVNAKNSSNKYGLHLAAGNNHIDVVKLLIEKGANLELLDPLESNALHFANTAEMVDVLCEAYAVQRNHSPSALKNWVNSRNMYSSSALYHCLEQRARGPRRFEVAARLLAHGADINSRRVSGDTILHKASASGDLELVEFIIRNPHSREQLKLSLKNSNNATAIFVAADSGNHAVLELFLMELCLSNEKFIKSIATPNKDNQNILHVAMRQNDPKIVEIMHKFILHAMSPACTSAAISNLFNMLKQKDSRQLTPIQLGLSSSGGSNQSSYSPQPSGAIAVIKKLLGLVISIIESPELVAACGDIFDVNRRLSTFEFLASLSDYTNANGRYSDSDSDSGSGSGSGSDSSSPSKGSVLAATVGSRLKRVVGKASGASSSTNNTANNAGAVDSAVLTLIARCHQYATNTM